LNEQNARQETIYGLRSKASPRHQDRGMQGATTTMTNSSGLKMFATPSYHGDVLLFSDHYLSSFHFLPQHLLINPGDR